MSRRSREFFDAKRRELNEARTWWQRFGKPTGVQHFGVAVCGRSPLHPFVARISRGGREEFLGRFSTPEAAHFAYVDTQTSDIDVRSDMYRVGR